MIAVDSAHPTGTVTVTVDSSGKPSYTIHEGVAWDFLRPTPDALAQAATADCVCFGTLAQRTPTTRAAIHALLAAARPDALRVLDINFRQRYYDQDIVESSLRAATVLKINDDEMPALAELLATPQQALFDRYPRLGLIALTRGARGSLLLARDGERDEHAAHAAAPLADTIGAGDAFTAALAVGLLAGRPLAQVNDAANRLAAYVCTQPGATPAIPGELRDSLRS
jgi:fructokinase